MEGGAVGHNFERDPPRFGLIWFSGFRKDDLNVIIKRNKIFKDFKQCLDN
jgi:hypothetical protein